MVESAKRQTWAIPFAGSLPVLVGLLSLRVAAQAPNLGAGPFPGMNTEVRVTPQGHVELHVDEQPLASVLRALSLDGRRNIVASPNVTGTVTANLYDVTFEEALTAILAMNQAGFKAVGNFIYVYTFEELAKMEADANPPITRVFPLNYVRAADAQSYIKPLLADDENATVPPPPDTSLASNATQAGSQENPMQDFIIVTARPQRLRTIEDILRKIDARPKQVLIEATILRAELTDDNALGIDFTVVGGVDLQLLGASSNAIQDLTLGELPENRFELFNSSAQTNFAKDVPEGGITIGIVKDHVAVFLRALEQVTDTTVLANPKVLALNKQKGQVIVGRRDGFLTTTVTETQAVQAVEFLETGTQLIFRPFIGDDGYVRVELHPEDSVGFVNAQGLPSEQTTEVTTNVIVRDGQTILIGGLFREVNGITRNQIPALGNIPVLGNLFRSAADSVTREEVIILMTLHVVSDYDAYADHSRDVLDNMERIRIGTRQGMMWHGRERLAQAHYRNALEAFSEGEWAKALWHANLAINNNARFVAAIELRERILGQQEWEGETTADRSFIHELITRETNHPIPTRSSPRIPTGKAKTDVHHDSNTSEAPSDAPNSSNP